MKLTTEQAKLIRDALIYSTCSNYPEARARHAMALKLIRACLEDLELADFLRPKSKPKPPLGGGIVIAPANKR